MVWRHRQPEWSGIAVVVAGSYVIVATADGDTVRRLCAEDQLVENLGALLFFAAAALFGAAAAVVRRTERRVNGRSRTILPGVILSLGLLWIALEEISYGQRLLGFRTPEVVAALNTQREFNAHNLRLWSGEDGFAAWYNVQRLFSLFWLGYCTIFSFAYRYSRWPERLCRLMYVPIPWMALGAIFLLNYAMAKVTAQWLVPSLVGPVTELKETNYALLFAWFAFREFLQQRRNATAEYVGRRPT